MPPHSIWPPVTALGACGRVRDAAARALLHRRRLRRGDRARADRLAPTTGPGHERAASANASSPERGVSAVPGERRSTATRLPAGCASPSAVARSAGRVVGDGAVPLQRGDDLRHDDRHLLLPPVRRAPLAAARHRAGEGRRSLDRDGRAGRNDRADVVGSPSGPRGIARRRCCWLVARALVVQAAYFGVQVALMAHDLQHFSPERRLRTARSTTRCSAPTTRTCCLAACSTSPCCGSWPARA